MRRTPSSFPVVLLFFVTAIAATGCFGTVRLTSQGAVMNSRGVAQYSVGDFDGAEASFRVALEYNDRYAEPYNNLGLVALQRGDVRMARRHFRAAIARNRDFASAWSNLGIALSRPLEDDPREPTLREAIGAFREALSIDPGMNEARVNLVRALLAAGNPDEALSQARRLTQLMERDSTAHVLRAECALELRAIGEAASEITVARALAPESLDVLFVSARVDVMLGARGVARRELQAIASHPEMATRAHALLAAIALADGDLEEARREIVAGGHEVESLPIGRAVIAATAAR